MHQVPRFGRLQGFVELLLDVLEAELRDAEKSYGDAPGQELRRREDQRERLYYDES
jgi:hypothetical protein